MIEHVKKYGIIAIIAILFTAFSFSIIEVVIEAPEYEDYCEIVLEPVEEPTSEEVLKRDKYCRDGFDEAQEHYRMIGFIITGILGLAAILVGIYSKSKVAVVEWIYSGLIIGGIITIFFGTVSYFDDMHRYVRPLILLVEMALIIFVAVKTYSKKKR